MNKKISIEEALQNTQKKRKRRKPAVIAIIILLICTLPILRLAAYEKDQISNSQNVEEMKMHLGKALIYAGSAFASILIFPCFLTLFLTSKEEEVFADYVASLPTKPEPDATGQRR